MKRDLSPLGSLLCQGLLTGFFVGALEGLLETALLDFMVQRGPNALSGWIACKNFGIPTAIFSGGLWAAGGAALALLIAAWGSLRGKTTQERGEELLWHLLLMGVGAAGCLALILKMADKQAPIHCPVWYLLGLLCLVGGWQFSNAAQRIGWRLKTQWPSLWSLNPKIKTLCLVGLTVGWIGIVVQRGGSTVTTHLENASPHQGPNVLILTIDSLRADHISLYGYPIKTTPYIDAFAQKGAFVFQDCQTHANWTKPAVASMITGRIFPRSELDLYDVGRLPPREVTLLERFSAAGYKTGWFAANPYITPEYGIPQQADRLLVPKQHGFLCTRLAVSDFIQKRKSFRPIGSLLYALIQRWADLANGTWRRPDWIRDEELRDAFLDWVTNLSPQTPWFAYIHLMAVHHPYGDTQGQHLAPFGNDAYPMYPIHATPRDLPSMQPYLAAYDADIPYTDACIGQIFSVLEERGDLNKTVVVITADHGEEFGEHGVMGHGRSFHQGVTHVPLILWNPKESRYHRVRTPVQLIDLAPTLLSICGLAQQPDTNGISLMKSAQESELIPPRFAYFGNDTYDNDGFSNLMATLRHGKYQLYISRTHRGTEAALYNVEKDPAEHHNVASSSPSEFTEVMEALVKIDPRWAA